MLGGVYTAMMAYDCMRAAAAVVYGQQPSMVLQELQDQNVPARLHERCLLLY